MPRHTHSPHVAISVPELLVMDGLRTELKALEVMSVSLE